MLAAVRQKIGIDILRPVGLVPLVEPTDALKEGSGWPLYAMWQLMPGRGGRRGPG